MPRTNSSGVTEVAHIRTNLDTYAENWDHIFKKYKCNCHLFENCVCDVCREDKKEQE